MPYCGLPADSDESTSTTPGTFRKSSIIALAYCSSLPMSGPPIMYWTLAALMPPPDMNDTGVTLTGCRDWYSGFFRMFFRTKSMTSSWP